VNETIEVPAVNNSTTNFLWKNFGQLVDVRETDKFLIIQNDRESELKISKRKYFPQLPALRTKLAAYLNRNIFVRTSKNTGDWNEDVWFSDVSDVDPRSAEQAPKITKIDASKSYDAESYFEQASREEREKIDSLARNLNAQLKRGDSVEAIVNRGHAMKMLALRHGINHEGRGRIRIDAIRPYKRNLWWVSIPDYGIDEVLVALAFERQSYYLISIEPKHPELFRAAVKEVTGLSEAQVKSNAKTTVEFLVNLYHKIEAVTSTNLKIH